MIKNTLALFFLILSSVLFPQKQGTELIDSMKSAAWLMPDDTAKVRLLGKISFQYFQFNTDSGLQYGEKALSLAEKLGWGTGKAFSYNYIATNYAVKGNYPSALEYFLKSLDQYTALNDRLGQAFIANNLGNLYRILHNYPKAIEYLNKAVELNLALNNRRDIAKNYNNLGFVFNLMKDYKQSNLYYNRSLELARENKDTAQIATAYLNIAENMYLLGSNCDALQLAYQGLALHEKIGWDYDMAIMLNLMGKIYKESAGVLRKEPCSYLAGGARSNLAKAAEYFTRSNQLLAEVNEYPMLSENSQYLAEIYEKLGDPVRALKYQKDYSVYRDSVISGDNRLKISEIEKEQEIELRDKQIEIQSLELEKKNFQIAAQIFIFILVFLVTGIIVYTVSRRKQLAKQKVRESEKKAADEALRASEEKYRSIFENSMEGYFHKTIEGRFLLANPRLASLLGYSSARALIEEVADIGTQVFYNPAERKEFIKDLLAKESVSGFIFRAKKKDGTPLWLFQNAHLVKDAAGNILYIEGFVVDFTAQKQLEEELFEAKEAAEQSNRLRASFLANMSHELRTPMVGILGYSEALMEEVKDENLRESAARIYKSSSRLFDTLNLILNISKLESGRFELQQKKADLHLLCSSVAGAYKDEAERKGVALKVSSGLQPVEIITNEEVLRSVLNYLINNGVKFTMKGEVAITIAKNTRADGAEEAIVEVRDTGIGIDKEHLGLIFEDFRQVSEGYGRNFEGTGLGLSVARKFAEKLGGSISVESRKGEGSVFTLRLPAAGTK